MISLLQCPLPHSPSLMFLSIYLAVHLPPFSPPPRPPSLPSLSPTLSFLYHSLFSLPLSLFSSSLPTVCVLYTQGVECKQWREVSLSTVLDPCNLHRLKPLIFPNQHAGLPLLFLPSSPLSIPPSLPPSLPLSAHLLR